mmetsp:Transcript_5375/g.8984  ORF Transcript_5375/g.8984 Transcript_5375/m.8984 type:complete len:208 (+) Transcript_5375:599-1222(+)
MASISRLVDTGAVLGYCSFLLVVFLSFFLPFPPFPVPFFFFLLSWLPVLSFFLLAAAAADDAVFLILALILATSSSVVLSLDFALLCLPPPPLPLLLLFLADLDEPDLSLPSLLLVLAAIDGLIFGSGNVAELVSLNEGSLPLERLRAALPVFLLLERNERCICMEGTSPPSPSSLLSSAGKSTQRCLVISGINLNTYSFFSISVWV